MDLAFAFETTKEGDGEFSEMKTFAAELTRHFKIGKSRSHISIATFSDTPNTFQSFSSSYDPEVIKQNIATLKSDGGASSNIGDFLRFAGNEIFGISGSVRQSSPRILVIFTKGKFPLDQEAKAKEEAAKLKADGKDVQIIVVNVGGSEQQATLKNIASEPTPAKLIKVLTVAELKADQIKQTIAEEICSSKKCFYKINFESFFVCFIHNWTTATDFIHKSVCEKCVLFFVYYPQLWVAPLLSLIHLTTPTTAGISVGTLCFSFN